MNGRNGILIEKERQSFLKQSIIAVAISTYLEYFVTQRIDVLRQDRKRASDAENGEGLNGEPEVQESVSW
jgi:hypothetical protein